jgi:hypothetical protein
METIKKYNRYWRVLAGYTFCDDDWFVMETEQGELFMNNVEGYCIFFENDGTILKSYI